MINDEVRVEPVTRKIIEHAIIRVGVDSPQSSIPDIGPLWGKSIAS